jgi:transcriptional antiterminator NusG
MADNNVKNGIVRAVSGQENKVKAYIETEILEMEDYVFKFLFLQRKWYL